MRISAKEDYAIRAVVELAAAGGATVKREQLAERQGIPAAFLENILLDLKRGEIVEAIRGADGGFRLARPPEEITVADVIRTVSGPLATVRGQRPTALEYDGSAAALQDLWIALRANIRSILETVTIADVASGKLPARVKKVAATPEAWR
ncbi:MAG TPA: Rrf2 family transcriptional regulator [Gaiellaceae bacterium]|nr:Rrf2 family transcriptional regulator [Gaiellaceae bacterium]